MRCEKTSSTIIYFLAACCVVLTALDQAKADIVYSFTGTLDTVNLEPAMPGDAFTFEFVVDDSVVPQNGTYSGAILSSSFDIENITVNDNFADGDVMVTTGSLTFLHPTDTRIGFSFSSDTPLAPNSLPQSVDFGSVFFVLADTSSGFGGGIANINTVPEPAASPLLLLVGFLALFRRRARPDLITTEHAFVLKLAKASPLW